MAESYEYPPSLTNYRPLQFERALYRPISFKLRHHFFITRAKILFKECMLYRDLSDQFQRNFDAEINNVLISQGWCSALGIPVPTPFFFQECLLGAVDDSDRGPRFAASMVKMWAGLEISDLDQRFHDDIMGGDGKWWRTDGAEAPSFNTLWKRLDERTTALADAGAFAPKPWDVVPKEEVAQILDPKLRMEKGVSSEPRTSRTRGKAREVHKPAPEDGEQLAALLNALNLPDIEVSDQDMGDLERIGHLTNAESQLVRLMEIEAETVETEKWNHDAAVQLVALAQSRNEIPFGKREELFSLRPTGEDPSVADALNAVGTSRKGKERAVDDPTKKRLIYHLLPAAAKESWLGETEHPLPPLNPVEKKDFDNLLEETLPVLFAQDAPHHDCIYRELVKRFVKEDVQRMSTERLTDCLGAQQEAIRISLGTWSDMPPLREIPLGGENREAHLVPSVFEHIAAISEAMLPPKPSTYTSPPQSQSEVEEETDPSSEWESEASSEEGMGGPLELDADTGEATFATL